MLTAGATRPLGEVRIVGDLTIRPTALLSGGVHVANRPWSSHDCEGLALRKFVLGLHRVDLGRIGRRQPLAIQASSKRDGINRLL